MKRLLSDRNGIQTTIEFSPDGKTFDVTKRQNVEPVLDLNKMQANHYGKKSVSECYNKVASIPAVIIAKWLLEDGLDIYNPDHSERLKRKLNDSEWQYLRTNTMRL